uniref:Sorting nexin-4 (Autophagy-related protein 24) n=1 Tax=Ganoderma boninense TaxID=34458 RepID=A0A5K1JUJ0_9APHY|nr:Sorting nexin-4 (Autophagy-related protein 24) [Ganoderma boninense]
MTATLGPPSIAHLRPKSSFSSLSDSAFLHNDNDPSATPRFPHTRAQLAAIARLYKPDAFLGDPDGDQNISPSLVARTVALLDAEREDELKGLLKDIPPFMIAFSQLEQHVLDLMHKHRDDIDNVPFLFLTPTRRPISRPSSRASTHSARLIPNRPDTPNSAPSSPLAMIFRRPHTPLSSPLGTTGPQPASYMSGRSESPGASPVITHAQFAVSLPSSPMLSPRLLNAKASEFKPIPRPLSAASSNPGSLAALRGETPSPDLWAPPSRPTSKLAIAAPLTPDSSLFHRAGTPNSSLRSSMRPDDDDDDPFDPFAARAIPRSFHPGTSDDLLWINSPISASSLSPDDSPFPQIFGSGMDHTGSSHEALSRQGHDDDMDPEMAAMLTDGMTPFDVLSSVFGATLAPSELEEALAANGYDFERAMTCQGYNPLEIGSCWSSEMVMESEADAQRSTAPRAAAAGVLPVTAALFRVEIVYADISSRGNVCGRTAGSG